MCHIRIYYATACITIMLHGNGLASACARAQHEHSHMLICQATHYYSEKKTNGSAAEKKRIHGRVPGLGTRYTLHDRGHVSHMGRASIRAERARKVGRPCAAMRCVREQFAPIAQIRAYVGAHAWFWVVLFGYMMFRADRVFNRALVIMYKCIAQWVLCCC